MLDDGDEDGDGDAAADAEPRGALAAVAAPTGASSPGSSQYGSASEGGAYADDDHPMLMSPGELSPPPPSGVGGFAAVAANIGSDNGLEAAPVGSPVGVARQLGAGIALLRHPGTAINVPLTQVNYFCNGSGLTRSASQYHLLPSFHSPPCFKTALCTSV